MLIWIGKSKRHIIWIQKMRNVLKKKGGLIKVILNLIR